MLEAVPTLRSLLVLYDALASGPAAVARELRARLGSDAAPLAPGRLHEIPTLYGGEDGPDLEPLARTLGMREAEIVALHAEREYTAFMLGFKPGFAYLGLVPEALECPRHRTPRVRVPAGSVALAGRQTAIYPVSSPGGWQLIGRTSVCLFDPWRDAPALVAPGDRVRFVEVAELPEPEAPVRRRRAASASPVAVVREPGLLTTVQDAGRSRPAAAGRGRGRRGRCPRARGGQPRGRQPGVGSGARMHRRGPDPRVPGAHALQRDGSRPRRRARARRPRRLAGASRRERARTPRQPAALRRSSQRLPRLRRAPGRDRRSAGARLARHRPRVWFWRPRGARAARGRPARHGQGGGRRRPPPWRPDPCATSVRVRVVLGPQDDHFTASTLGRFLSDSWRVGASSDRIGLRLEGEPLHHRGPAEILSDGMLPGSIQVPPDGQPILMLADAPTTGGYPKIATVLTADLPLLAQLVPGEGEVRFEPVSLDDCRRAPRDATAPRSSGACPCGSPGRG